MSLAFYLALPFTQHCLLVIFHKVPSSLLPIVSTHVCTDYIPFASRRLLVSPCPRRFACDPLRLQLGFASRIQAQRIMSTSKAFQWAIQVVAKDFSVGASHIYLSPLNCERCNNNNKAKSSSCQFCDLDSSSKGIPNYLVQGCDLIHHITTADQGLLGYHSTIGILLYLEPSMWTNASVLGTFVLELRINYQRQ